MVPNLFRSCNGDARGIVRQAHILAGLDATLASASNDVAKTKLLVLPVYPAAWPQAKKQPFVQAVFNGCKALASLYLVKKVSFRYRQAGIAGTAAFDSLERIAGLTSVVRWLRNAHVAKHLGVEKPTQKLRSFFSRWSIKFSVEYYEAKEQQAAPYQSSDH